MARGYSDAAAAAQNLGFEGKRLRRSSLDAPLPFPSHAFALAFFHCSRCFARAPLRIYAVRIELCIAPRVLMQADSTLLLLPPSSMPLSLTQPLSLRRRCCCRCFFYCWCTDWRRRSPLRVAQSIKPRGGRDEKKHERK